MFSEFITYLPVAVLAVPAVLSLLFLGLSISHFRKSHWVRCGVHTSFSLFFAFASALFLGITLNIHTYQRLTYEQPVAELSFTKVADRQFLALLSRPNGASTVYELRGDEWQLDARTLKWHGIANLLGFDAMCRLERLSGRYSSDEDETRMPRTAYDLSEDSMSITDVWQWAHGLKENAPWVDAVYGSAAYLPMNDGSVYFITLGQSGLIARMDY